MKQTPTPSNDLLVIHPPKTQKPCRFLEWIHAYVFGGVTTIAKMRCHATGWEGQSKGNGMCARCIFYQPKEKL